MPGCRQISKNPSVEASGDATIYPGLHALAPPSVAALYKKVHAVSIDEEHGMANAIGIEERQYAS